MTISIQKIFITSILFLYLPTALFLWFWFRWELALPLVGIFSYLAWQYYSHTMLGESSFKLSILETCLLVFLALFFTFISGTGALAPQMPDHITHVTKIKELAENNWPVIYPKTGHFAKYYFGYSIVPALLSRYIGFGYNTSHFIFTAMGLWLGFIWLYKHCQRKYLGIIFILYFMPNVYEIFRSTIETNLNGIYFGGIWPIISQLFWNPNQTIPALLGTCLLYQSYHKESLFYFIFVPIAILPFAVFPALYLGALWFVLLLFKIDFSNITKSLLSLPWVSYIGSLSILISLGIYFSSSKSTLHQGFLYNLLGGNTKAFLIIMGLQIVLIIGILAVILLLFNTNFIKIFKQKPFIISLVLLFIFGNFVLGLYNDLFMRGQICLLIIPLIYVFNTWQKSQNKLAQYCIALFFIYVGWTNFKNDTITALQNNYFIQKMYPAVQYKTYAAMPNVEEVMLNIFVKDAINQYLSNENSFYAKVLAPKHIREQAAKTLRQ